MAAAVNSGLPSNQTPDDEPILISCWDEERVHISCYNIWRDFYFYTMSIIIPLGLIFNSVSLGVFATSWMRRTIPGRYFMALAVADNLVLFSEFIMWLNTVDTNRGRKLGIGFFHTTNAFCKLVYFMRYGSRIWSSWVTVSITIERFLTIALPFKVIRLSSPNKVILVVLVEAVVCYSIALFPVFMVETRDHNNYLQCLIIQKMYTIYHYFVMVLMAGIGELVLPSAIMCLFTCLIIIKLYQAHLQRLRMSSSEARSQQRKLQPTIALVAIAVAFIIIRLPYLIMFYINQYSGYIFPNITPGGSLRIYAAYKIAQALAVTNYAINFFIFCMAGNTFREEMGRCFGQRRSTPLIRGRQHGSISSTMTFRERATSHVEFRMTSYGSATIREKILLRDQAADSISDSVSGSFLPALDVTAKMSLNGLDHEESWQ